MPDAAVALGSNLGDRDANLREAIRRIGETVGTVLAVSSFHDTAPVGQIDQPRFLNAAMTLRTLFPPDDLLRALLDIELAMGRVRSVQVPPKGPRLIDLDLLLYANVVQATEALCLPHPEMTSRRFVLDPLAEIAGNWVVPEPPAAGTPMGQDRAPGASRTVAQLLSALQPG